MRNLKKVLALVLVLALSLSFLTIATAADFSDDADIDYSEAVDVMVAAGIIDGDGSFYPAGKLTGFAFAKMLLTALGYDSQIEKFVGAGWTIPVATIGMEVGLDNGLERTFGNAEISRQEAAQMALNAIKAPLVQYPNKGNSVSVNGVVVDFTSQQYEYITTTIARTQTISDQKLSNSDKYTIKFGEKYLPKLELRRETDDFARPAYTWAYDKKEIGTYMDDTDLVAEFTTEVTGKDLYDAITKNVREHLDNDEINVFIDGETDDTINPAIFTADDVKRTNTDGLDATEKGVLTQVFVTRKEGDRETTYDVKVVIINTYLAIASEDYDSKNGEVDLDVYSLFKTSAHTSKKPDYIKTEDQKISVTVEDENIDVSNVKDEEMFLVTMADGKVQTMAAPEIVADASIDSFKKGKDVTVEGKTYEYADTAMYDEEVLERYSNTNLKDTTYNVILDQYGYLIGIEQNTEADQYVFLTGMNGNTSDLTTKNADANVIFLDGKMETVTVNVKKSDLTTESGPQMNTWCTYSVNSAGVYTLKEVANADNAKIGQSKQDVSGASEVKIDKKNVSLKNAAGTGNVYGNDDTVFINVITDVIKAATDADPDGGGNFYHVIIDDVDSVTVGARNASLVVVDQTVAGTGKLDEDSTSSAGDGPKPITQEIYPLFKDNGYMIAAVTIGVEDGVNKTYAYIHTADGTDGIKRESYNKADDEWTWVREAIVDGKVVDLTEVGDGTALSELEDMEQGAWYELRLDADGNVKGTTKLIFKAFAAGTNEQFINNVDDVDAANNAKDTVIMQVASMDDASDKLTYKAGTLYTDKTQTEGFSVSPEVKTVLCLSGGEGNLYDDVDDSYDGRKGLENAIRNLDSSFTGELNVVFDKGDAVVIILVDGTVADDDDGDDDGDDNTVEPQGDMSIGGDFVKTPAADGFVGTDPDSNQDTIKALNDGAYVLFDEVDKDTVLNGDVNGDLSENIIFKWRNTGANSIANLVIKDEEGNVVYREQASFTTPATGHFFIVRVTYRTGSSEEWYSTTNSTGFGPLTKGPLAVGTYTWEISGTNVSPVAGEFTISK